MVVNIMHNVAYKKMNLGLRILTNLQGIQEKITQDWDFYRIGFQYVCIFLSNTTTTNYEMFVLRVELFAILKSYMEPPTFAV